VKHVQFDAVRNGLVLGDVHIHHEYPHNNNDYLTGRHMQGIKLMRKSKTTTNEFVNFQYIILITMISLNSQNPNYSSILHSNSLSVQNYFKCVKLSGK